MRQLDWIAVDWGTSHLRAWLMTADDKVIERRQSNDGMAGLTPSEFPTTLAKLIGDFSGPIIACGMVGSRQGWAEAPYSLVPCAPPSAREATRVGQVHILPGVKQTQPAEVMRGEETQIAGYLAQNPEYDGILCLPGTHTKWVHISAGEIVSFRTAMTGELFALLTDHSVLRHSAGSGWDQDAFADAISDALSKPEALAARLFQVRAENLLQGTAPAIGRARVSGLLIGAELAAMRPYWLGQAVNIIGAADLCANYQKALGLQGVVARTVDGDAMTLAGMVAARAALEVT